MVSFAFWLVDILSCTTRATSSVNETKAPRHFVRLDWWKISLCRQEGYRVFSRLKYSWSKVLQFRYLASFSAIPNAMDPKVAKLLEGKTDQEKFQAIAFSFGCLLTRPTINSPVDAPMKGKTAHIAYILFLPAFVLLRSLLCDWMLNVIAPSFTGELKAKKKSRSKPKYSFEELSD